MQPDPDRFTRFYGRLPPDAYARRDEEDDAVFYERPRLVPHLDARALATVQRVVEALVVEEYPHVLDLMASFDSHLPDAFEPARVVGLGLNAEELEANEALDERVIHDLNADPVLPFKAEQFDLVINTVSVDYLTKPLQVFYEVGRVLKPGGLHLVVFSNRMFPPKAVKIWAGLCEEDRVSLVAEYFLECGAFEEPQVFFSKGFPRPAEDRYAEHGIPSDPVYTVYADRVGGAAGRPARPALESEDGLDTPKEVIEERKRKISETLCCPYCEVPLTKEDVPESPFLEWDNEFFHICYNNACPYMRAGWEAMEKQGNQGFTYRLLYDSIRDRCRPLPVATPAAETTFRAGRRG